MSSFYFDPSSTKRSGRDAERSQYQRGTSEQSRHYMSVAGKSIFVEAPLASAPSLIWPSPSSRGLPQHCRGKRRSEPRPNPLCPPFLPPVLGAHGRIHLRILPAVHRRRVPRGLGLWKVRLQPQVFQQRRAARLDDGGPLARRLFLSRERRETPL